MPKYRSEAKLPDDTEYESFSFEEVHAKQCTGVIPKSLCKNLMKWLYNQQTIDQDKYVYEGLILEHKFIPICIAACNEDAEGVRKTIHHIMKMFEFMNMVRYKDTERWRKTRDVFCALKPLIIIVCDGAKKLSPSMRAWLNAKYPDLLAEVGNGMPSAAGTVDVKIGCRTWYHDCEAAVTRDQELVTERALNFKMAVVVKRENHRKHNSHMWFFAFCRGLGTKVDYVLLTDAETSFRHDCLAHLVKELHFSPGLIAVTGQMFCEAPSKYFHPGKESWWSRLQCKHGPTAASPCMRCYFAYYLFSPAPVQAFECIVSVLINSLVFNVVEALPCMPGPCQLLNWQKVVKHGVVEKYFSYLLGENEPLPSNEYPPVDIEGEFSTPEPCTKCNCGKAVIPDVSNRQDEGGIEMVAFTPKSSSTSTCTRIGCSDNCHSPAHARMEDHWLSMEDGGLQEDGSCVLSPLCLPSTSATRPYAKVGSDRGRGSQASSPAKSPVRSPVLVVPTIVSTLSHRWNGDAVRRDADIAPWVSLTVDIEAADTINPMSPLVPPISLPPQCPCSCHSMQPENEKTDVLKENGRIGEDRMFSNFLVYCSGYGTRIVTDAIFYYEPMMTWTEYLVQRRRWINGATAATLYFFSHESARMRIEATTFTGAEKGAQHPQYVDVFWFLQLTQTALLMFSLSMFVSASYGGLNSMANFWPGAFGWALDDIFHKHHPHGAQGNASSTGDLAVHMAFDTVLSLVSASLTVDAANATAQPSFAPTWSPTSSLVPSMAPTMHPQEHHGGNPNGTITGSHVWAFFCFAYFAVWQIISFYWSDIAKWYEKRYQPIYGEEETKERKKNWEEGYVLLTVWFGFVMSIPIYASMFYSLYTVGWLIPTIFMLIYLLATPALAIFTNKWVIGQYLLLTIPFLVSAVFILVMIPAYSLARIWDTSWGTRGATNEHNMSLTAEKSVKIWTTWICRLIFGLNIVVCWILSLIHYLGATATDLLIIIMFLPMMIQVAFGLGYRIGRLIAEGYAAVKERISTCTQFLCPSV